MKWILWRKINLPRLTRAKILTRRTLVHWLHSSIQHWSQIWCMCLFSLFFEHEMPCNTIDSVIDLNQRLESVALCTTSYAAPTSPLPPLHFSLSIFETLLHSPRQNRTLSVYYLRWLHTWMLDQTWQSLGQWPTNLWHQRLHQRSRRGRCVNTAPYCTVSHG